MLQDPSNLHFGLLTYIPSTEWILILEDKLSEITEKMDKMY